MPGTFLEGWSSATATVGVDVESGTGLMLYGLPGPILEGLLSAITNIGVDVDLGLGCCCMEMV